MATVALLSNPRSTGNVELLPRVRDYVARTPSLFHVELHDVGEIAAALRLMARVKPDVLVINGGDGTVQATLTSLYYDKPFGDSPPPVAILPNGKTNLIAVDLGVTGAPLKALDRIVQLVKSGDMAKALVRRSLISIEGGRGHRPIVGMFLGAAGLMKTILFCRHKLYPLGLPNGLAHAVAYGAFAWSILTGSAKRATSPFNPDSMRVTVPRAGTMEGKFAVLMTTTLENLLLGITPAYSAEQSGELKLICVEQKRKPVFSALWATLMGRLGQGAYDGVHVRRGDEIRLEGASAGVILDGEMVAPGPGGALILRSTAPQQFLSLAAR
jgi:hypothetical protein